MQLRTKTIWIGTEDAAYILGLTQRTVQTYCKKGLFTVRRRGIGKRAAYEIPQNEVIALKEKMDKGEIIDKNSVEGIVSQ